MMTAVALAAPAAQAGIGRIQSVPSDPTSVTAAPGDRQITADWNIAPDAIHFYVWVTTVQGAAYPGDGFCDPGDDLLPATNPCIIFNLTNGTPYYVYVRAENNSGVSQPVAANGGATVTPSAPVGPPSGVSSTTGTGQITVNWNPAAGGQGTIRYQAWASTLANDPYPGQRKCPDSTDITGTSCTITGLTGGTGYHVYVQAVDDTSTSAATSASGDPLIVPAAALGAPTAVTATAGNGKITAGWTNVTGAPTTVQYRVWAAATVGSAYPGNAKCADSGPITAGPCTITGLTNGTAYHVYVQAVDQWGTSSPAAPAGDPAVTPHLPVAPGAPRSVSVLPGTDELVVSWQAPTDAGGGVTGYIVDVATGGSVVGHCGPTTALTCTASGLTAGVAYQITVMALGAVDGVMSGPAAATGTFTPVAPVVDVPTPATVPSPDGTLQADKTSMTSGDVVTISGTGFAADTLIEITMYSTPRLLKTVMTDKTGAFSTTVSPPAGVTGSHTLVAGGMSPNGSFRYLTVPVTVAAAASGLAVTGAQVQQLAAVGVLIALFGVGLLVVTRRRKARL